jgi:hypothetical protein
MKKFIALNAVAATLLAASGLLAPDAIAGICPHVGGEVDCGAVLSVGPGGVITSFNTNGQNYGLGTIDTTPYDGSDDALVGVINNSGGILNSLHLTGSGNGGGIFAFEGDGQQTVSGGVLFTPPSPFTHTGYEGPNTAFTNIGLGGTSGDVIFIGGLADGATAWFSLEGSPQSLQITPGNNVPEPGTLALLGIGFLVFSAARRRTQ